MGDGSKIEWTEATWNPVVGCTVLSDGCTNCYAMRLAHRLAAMGQDQYKGLTRISAGRPKWVGHARLNRAALDVPNKWARGRLIFVNSMSDLFHEDVSFDEIKEIISVIKETPQHTYQILTKRAERLKEFSSEIEWPDNLWMGVSVENSKVVARIDDLRVVPSAIRFLSLEPLLGPLEELNLEGIDWVIAGGESGPGSRKVEADWIRDIRDQCLQSSTAFLFKQWGGTNKKISGRVLDGRTWDQMPTLCH